MARSLRGLQGKGISRRLGHFDTLPLLRGKIRPVSVDQIVAQDKDIHVRAQEAGNGFRRGPHHGLVFVE